jgi:hypothetical protein
VIDEIEMLSALGLNKFVDPSALVEKAIERRDNPEKGIALPWSKLSGVELPKTGVSLIGGYSGHSKSTIVNQISLNACAQGHKVCMASLELTSDYLFSMLASQSACKGGDMHDDYLHRFGRWLDQRMFIVDHADTMSMDEAIQLIIDSKRLLGCDMFVLDCLMMIDLGGELEQEKRFFSKLGAIARSHEIAIVVVHHMRKPQGPEGEGRVPTRDNFIGSSHLVNASSVILICWQDAKKAAAKHSGAEVDDDSPCYVISCAKNRFSPFTGMVGLYMHNEARLLCNSRGRQYKPIDLSEDTWTSKNEQSGESPAETTLVGLPGSSPPETSHNNASTTSSMASHSLSRSP